MSTESMSELTFRREHPDVDDTLTNPELKGWGRSSKVCVQERGGTNV